MYNKKTTVCNSDIWPCVCPCLQCGTRRHCWSSIETAERIELDFGMEVSLYSMFIPGIFSYNSPLPKLFSLNLFSARTMNNKYIKETLF